MNARNQKKTGAVEAETQSQAIAILRDRGLIVQEIIEAKNSDEPTSIWNMDFTGDIHKAKIKPKRLLSLYNQLAMMMKAGINLSLSMKIMIEGEKEQNIRKILKEINEGLYNGLTLSQAMSNFKTFPSLYISIISAGEANGRLDDAFEQCALILKKDLALSGKIRGALGYPIFMMALVVVLLIILCVFVLPTFKGVYGSFGAELPGLTLAVMAFSDFLINFWWLLIIIVVGVVFGFTTLKKNSAEFAMLCARIALKIPLIGPIMRQNSTARFCRLMFTLTEAGIPIHRAMALARDTIPNLYMRARVQDVINDVQIGVTIHEAMGKHPVFDPILVSMIQVGEESGMLSDSLFKMAEMYEAQVDESTNRLTEMMTPIMTVVIGLVVGVVVVSMILPMFGVYSVIDTGT